MRTRFLLFFCTTFFLVFTACNPTGADQTDLEGTVSAQGTQIAKLLEDENLPATSTTPTEVPQIKEIPIITLTSPPSSANNNTQGVEPVIANDPEVQEKEGADLLWSIEAESFAIVEDKVYIQTPDGIQALNIENGEVTWTADIGGTIATADNDNLYLIPAKQRIDAVNLETGDLAWTSSLPIGVYSLDFPLANVRANSSRIMVYTENSTTTWLDKATGDANFVQNVFHETLDDVAITETNDKKIEGWSTDTISPLWSVDNGNFVDICNDTLLIIRETSLQALELTSGKVLWQLPEYGYVFCNSDGTDTNDIFDGRDLVNDLFSLGIPIDVSNKIFLSGTPDDGRGLTAVDITSGQVLWNGNMSYLHFDRLRPYLDEFHWLGEAEGQIIYTHVNFGKTYSYDAQTHEPLWENNQVTLVNLLGGAEGIIVGREWANFEESGVTLKK